MGIRKWEKSKKNQFAKYFFIGIAAGLAIGIVTNRLGIFLPLGGIVGMCVGVNKKSS